MAAVAEELSIFENEEWLVTASGLEHKGTGYFIERESLGAKRGDGLWSWPLHMAEKTWCAMAPFAEAFSCAVAFHRIESDIDLARTFTIARREIAAWPSPSGSGGKSAATSPAALQQDLRDPILVQRKNDEEPDDHAAFHVSDASVRERDVKGFRPLSAHGRLRPSRFDLMRATSFRWRAPKRIRRTGTKLVRMIQAAWNIK